MKKQILHLISLASITLLLVGCSYETRYDIILGQQPNFPGVHQFIPGLNILGVIRPDSAGQKSMNLIYLEKVIPAVSPTPDSTVSLDFNLQLYKIDQQIIVDSLCYSYHYPDTTYTHHPSNFGPQAGNHFKIICKSSGLPYLTAETIIPNLPVINSVTTNNNKVQFAIDADSTAFLYDVYLFVDEQQYFQRILRAKTGSTTVEMAANLSNGQHRKLMIYAYDKNLSEYLTTPNLFIKPNTYRPPFSTVRNGYGCFGSLNVLKMEF